MPEAAGRDLSVERQHLPAAAHIETFTYRGEQDALIFACRAADAILTDYVPFSRDVLQRLPSHPVNRLAELLPFNWKPAIA